MKDKIVEIRKNLINSREELIELAIKESASYLEAVEKLQYALDHDIYVNGEMKILIVDAIEEIKSIALKNATK